MTYMVNKLTDSATTTIAHCSASIAAPTSANFATKPENGGSPAMLKAGSAYSTAIIGALRSFDLISVMTSGGPFGSSKVLAYYMFEVSLSEYGFRMGYGAAIAVVLFAIMMIFITYFLWSMYREEKR